MTFYFYDLETSGVNPRLDRVMQFAGQRTDINLQPVGEPDNYLIKMTNDILPQPEAILVTAITPQQTFADGLTEAEFLRYFEQKIFTEDTIMVGFNNIRFDDEFMRFMLWRNFYDAYEWQWKKGCSRWDLLDVARMTRALRPDGIKWPFASDGSASNRLELLSGVNKLEHLNAHDAMSDVTAAIAVARLLKQKQPKLFEYLLNLRGKNKAMALVSTGEPFIYTSGKYPSEFEKTTVAVRVADHPARSGALVYDLRIDPKDFMDLSPHQLAELWGQRGKDAPYFPVKTLIYNRCPAIAPVSVINDQVSSNLQLEPSVWQAHLQKLRASKNFADNLKAAIEIMYPPAQPALMIDPHKVDELLYDGFVGPADKDKLQTVRQAQPAELSDLVSSFSDERLKWLLPLYKARNFPATLNPDEMAWWEDYRSKKLFAGGKDSLLSRYFARLDELASKDDLNEQQHYLLEELKLYGQSLAPYEP